MPTYVYRREDGTTFEVFQRISDDPLKTDPETGQPVERVIGGGAGLIFKGSGFYETDYVRKSGGSDKSESKSESSTSDSATSSGGSTSEGGSKKTESKDSGA